MSSVPNVKSDNILMQQFTGTKTVKAGVCSRKCAEELIGRKMRPDSDEIEDEEGYLVVYPDGYKSWSPVRAFESAYRPSETYLDRMKIEHEQLSERYLAGREFTFTQKFRDLSEKERNLLMRQLNEMEGYLYVLGERISYASHNLTEAVTPATLPHM